MSIASEITRLQTAKADIKAAIEDKGVTVPSAATLDDYADYVSAISGGGGGEYSADDFADNTKPTGIITLNGTSIGSYTFRGRTGVTGIVAENVTVVKEQALYGCTGLTSINFPSVTSFEFSAFKNCTNLTSARLENLRTTTGDTGFDGCSNLESVYLPKLTSLGNSGNYYFRRCVKLGGIVLPMYNGRFGTGIFENCGSLKYVDVYSVNISASSTGKAFLNCTILDTIIIRNNSVSSLNAVTSFDGTPFASNGVGGTLYVPNSLISNYQGATNWSTILGYTNNNIVAIEGSQYENYYADGTPISA